MTGTGEIPFHAREWLLAHGKSLTLGPKAVLMGILNVTPDSFSDGGEIASVDDAVTRAIKMSDDGAAIVDVGGESTKPGAVAVSAEQEQARVLPVVKALSELPNMLISIDTYRADTARKAVEMGAHIINDVWGCQKEPEIADVVVETGSGLCAMHTGRERNRDRDVIADQFAFLEKTLEIAANAGIGEQQIVLDPGFGFAKDPVENLSLLARFEELHDLKHPLLVGTSRKRFIGHATGNETDKRDIATAATSVVARMKGGALFRVHDIAANRDA
ncbi:MAG: dihydropteroate synthase, partial [Pseudomonadota bacterium]